MTAAPFFAFLSRPLPLIAGIALVAAAVPASAQTTIRMTTVAGDSCVAVTDANGLTLIPGSTDLQATGVTLSGSGCGGQAVSPPTSTDGLQLAASPASPTVGQAFSVSWNVSNATSCVGTVTAGSSANVAGWTQTSSPTSPRSVTIAVAGNYTLQLSCTNGASSPLVSPPLPLTVQAGGGGQTCNGPTGLTRLMTSDINYGYGAGVRSGVVMTEWNNIWGHYSATDGVTPWPGISGAEPVIRNFGRTTYLAAHFNTGSTLPVTAVGWYWYNSNFNGPNIDMSISTTCGDFQPNTTNPGCVRTNIVSGDNLLVKWNYTFTNPNYICTLAPNTDYYVNIKLSDPNTTVECPQGSPTCQVGTTHYNTPIPN